MLRKPPVLLIVVAVLILLLPLLAYLQYDWLGKVSEREREQMQTALRHTLSQFREDFDGEIARLFLEFEQRPDQMDKLAGEYAKVYAHWNSTAPYPKLVRDIFLAQPGYDSVEKLQRLNLTSGVWEPADWVTEFGPRRPLENPVDGKIPALVIPMFQILHALGPETIPVPTTANQVIVRLNLEYIQKEFVPALIHSHLANNTSEYRLQISDREDGSHIIYSSEAGPPLQGDGDAQENILALRLPEYRSLMPATFGFAAAEASTGFTAGAASTAGVRADRTFSIQLLPGIAHALHGEAVMEAEPGVWRITAAHRSGSLDAAVGQLRRRNLAVSFSILTLLAMSIAFVLVSANRAQRLARQQMEFVSTVSHELRTPLAVICSAGENLADGVVRDADQLKSYGKVVRNEGRRLTEMVEQVLSFAGIQSGLKKYTLVPVELAAIVERALSAFEVQIRENGFTVERHIAKDVPPVMADPVSLTRAVQNLISNALKYSGSSRWIGISVFVEGTSVKLAVQDCGSGIASADLPHIFEPFYRGRSSMEAQIQGSGLGLSLVKQTVDAHHGQIQVTSNPGSGSTFSIALTIA